MAVAGDGVTPPERRVDIRRDVAGSARSEPGHDDFPLSAFGDEEDAADGPVPA